MEDSLTKLFDDKNKEVENLLNKLQTLETKLNYFEERTDSKATETSNVEDVDNPLEKTFVNPSSLFKCEYCDFVSETNDDLNKHMTQKHEEPVSELKFQLYAVVENNLEVMDARTKIIEKLNKQKEIENILSVFVNSRCRMFYDRDGKLLTEADIKFKTKYENLFRSSKFRKSLFENCQLRETFPFQNGRMTREEYVKFRNETGWR